MKTVSAVQAPPVQAQAASPANLTTRAVGVLGLAAVIAIHALDLPGKLSEVPYLGYAYMVLMVGSALAALLILQNVRRGWQLGAALALGAVVAYALDRTVGLPLALGDIGNWGEPLGVASLIAEGVVVAAAYSALTPREAPGLEPFEEW